jgi:hypothetical protein
MAYLFFETQSRGRARWIVRHVDRTGVAVEDALAVTERAAVTEAVAEAVHRYGLDPDRIEIVPSPGTSGERRSAPSVDG